MGSRMRQSATLAADYGPLLCKFQSCIMVNKCMIVTGRLCRSIIIAHKNDIICHNLSRQIMKPWKILKPSCGVPSLQLQHTLSMQRFLVTITSGNRHWKEDYVKQ
jgi:hypothetical protein